MCDKESTDCKQRNGSTFCECKHPGFTADEYGLDFCKGTMPKWPKISNYWDTKLLPYLFENGSVWIYNPVKRPKHSDELANCVDPD